MNDLILRLQGVNKAMVIKYIDTESIIAKKNYFWNTIYYSVVSGTPITGVLIVRLKSGKVEKFYMSWDMCCKVVGLIMSRS